MSGGGNGGMFSDPLTLALVAGTAIAAPYAAPLLFGEGAALGGLGLAGDGMLATGLTGAGLGALGGAVTGRNPVQTGLMGGLGGAAAGAMGVGAGSGGPQLVDAVSGPIGPTVAGAGTSLIPGISNTTLGYGAAGLGLMGLMNQDKKNYGIPTNTNWDGGSLSKFRYSPDRYNPDTVTPPNPRYQAQYVDRRNPPDTVTPMTPYQPVMMAAGGGLMQDRTQFAAGGMYPMSQQDPTQFATSPQMPASMQGTMAGYEPNTNPLTGEPTAHMAGGGLADLGGYSDGGRMLKGPGDGMSDSIPATIGRKQPARLADNEFVVPADVVSHLGNGSSDAGAKKLYSMMNNVRKARTGKKKQAPQINAAKYMPA